MTDDRDRAAARLLREITGPRPKRTPRQIQEARGEGGARWFARAKAALCLADWLTERRPHLLLLLEADATMNGRELARMLGRLLDWVNAPDPRGTVNPAITDRGAPR